MLLLTEQIRQNVNSAFTLNKCELEAYYSIIKILYNYPTLARPQPNWTTYHLGTDTSKYVAGSALHQVVDANPIPKGFFSKNYHKCKSNIPHVTESSSLHTLHFQHMIESQQVLLLMDYKPLSGAFHSLNPAKSEKQQRQLALLST